MRIMWRKCGGETTLSGDCQEVFSLGRHPYIVSLYRYHLLLLHMSEIFYCPYQTDGRGPGGIFSSSTVEVFLSMECGVSASKSNFNIVLFPSLCPSVNTLSIYKKLKKFRLRKTLISVVAVMKRPLYIRYILSTVFCLPSALQPPLLTVEYLHSARHYSMRTESLRLVVSGLYSEQHYFPCIQDAFLIIHFKHLSVYALVSW